jgi:hypothetical protein
LPERQKVLAQSEIMGLLDDAASAHDNAAMLNDNAQLHQEVAALIKKIISGGNSVRRA